MNVEKITEKVNASEAITGAKMATYLRQISMAIEKSGKLFTAKLTLTVITK